MVDELSDEYDLIILLSLIKDQLKDPQRGKEGWGTNEIIRLVSDKMSQMTALNHIRKLKDMGVLYEKSHNYIEEIRKEINDLFPQSTELEELLNIKTQKKSGKKYPLLINYEKLKEITTPELLKQLEAH